MYIAYTGSGAIFRVSITLNDMYCDLFQAKFNEDLPSEIHSKMHLVDLAGR